MPGIDDYLPRPAPTALPDVTAFLDTPLDPAPLAQTLPVGAPAPVTAPTGVLQEPAAPRAMPDVTAFLDGPDDLAPTAPLPALAPAAADPKDPQPNETTPAYLERLRVMGLGDVQAGLESGWAGLQGLAGAGAAVAGQALGLEPLQDWGVDLYRRKEAQQAPYQAARTTQIEQIDSVGSAADWAQFQLGNLAPSMAVSLGSALIGGLAGGAAGSAAAPGAGTAVGAVGGALAGFFEKAAVKRLLGARVAELVAAAPAGGLVAAKAAAETVAKRELAQRVGMGAGLFGSSYLMGVGDIGGETMDADGQVNTAASLLLALPYAAADAVTDMAVLTKVLRGTDGQKALARYTRAMLSSANLEGAGESAQEGLLMLAGLASGKTYDAPDVMSRLGNSYAAGALGGVVLGAGGGRQAPVSEEDRAQATLGGLALVGLAGRPEVGGVPVSELASALRDPATEPSLRARAIAQVEQALRVSAPELSDLWVTRAEQAFAAGAPIPVPDTLDDPRAPVGDVAAPAPEVFDPESENIGGAPGSGAPAQPMPLPEGFEATNQAGTRPAGWDLTPVIDEPVQGKQTGKREWLRSPDGAWGLGILRGPDGVPVRVSLQPLRTVATQREQAADQAYADATDAVDAWRKSNPGVAAVPEPLRAAVGATQARRDAWRALASEGLREPWEPATGPGPSVADDTPLGRATALDALHRAMGDEARRVFATDPTGAKAADLQAQLSLIGAERDKWRAQVPKQAPAGQEIVDTIRASREGRYWKALQDFKAGRPVSKRIAKGGTWAALVRQAEGINSPEELGAALEAMDRATMTPKAAEPVPAVPDADAVVTLYRGESSANDANGQWWTTNRAKAEKYGAVTSVQVSALDIGKHAAQGHGGADEFVFPTDGRRPPDLAAGQKASPLPTGVPDVMPTGIGRATTDNGQEPTEDAEPTPVPVAEPLPADTPVVPDAEPVGATGRAARETVPVPAADAAPGAALAVGQTWEVTPRSRPSQPYRLVVDAVDGDLVTVRNVERRLKGQWVQADASGPRKMQRADLMARGVMARPAPGASSTGVSNVDQTPTAPPVTPSQTPGGGQSAAPEIGERTGRGTSPVGGGAPSGEPEAPSTQPAVEGSLVETQQPVADLGRVAGTAGALGVDPDAGLTTGGATARVQGAEDVRALGVLQGGRQLGPVPAGAGPKRARAGYQGPATVEREGLTPEQAAQVRAAWDAAKAPTRKGWVQAAGLRGGAHRRAAGVLTARELGELWAVMDLQDEKTDLQDENLSVSRETVGAEKQLPRGVSVGGEPEITALYQAVDSGRVPANEKRAVRYATEDGGARTAQVSHAAGVDVAGWAHSVDSFAMRKVVKDHGSATTEATRGQLPIDAADWARLPEIISDFDAVEAVGEDGHGTALLRYRKQFNGTTYYVEEVRKKRKELAAKTMWKTRTAMSDADGPAQTPAAFGRNLPQGLDSVDQETPTDNQPAVTGAVETGVGPVPTEPPPAQPPKAAEPTPAEPAYGAANVVFTADAAEKARALLKRKLGQLSAGLDPEIIQAGITLAGYHIEAGARTFAAYAQAMVGDLGEQVRPFLRGWYEGARYYPGFDAKDMTPAAEMDAAVTAAEQPTTLKAEPQPEPTHEPPTDTPDQTGVRPDRGDGMGRGRPEGTGDDRPVAADTAADGGQTGTGGDSGGVRPSDRESTDRGDRPVPGGGDGVAGQSGGSEPGLADRGSGRPGRSQRPGGGPDATAGDGSTGTGAAVGAGAGAQDQGGAGGAVEPVTADEPSTAVDLAARAENFHADEPERIYGGTPKVRFNKNRRAIEVYRELEETGRHATADEREVLAGYTGWGSFGQELFQGTWERTVDREGWRNEDAWLRGHLGESEWKAAQASIINAHYTDPPTVQAIWAAVQRLGFQGGRVLEPAAGVGNFFAMMPKAIQDASQLTGIEMDELSSGILKHLYPNATISNKPYQDSQTPDGFYDLVIGNWPFASAGPADRRYNKLSPSLHDYFFLKALDQVRAGGLVVGITSRYSLDGKGNAVRQALARKADLVAAYRLPSGAFEQYAGTKVVTDLIILKKRETENTDPQAAVWTQTEDLDLGADGQKAAINRYYLLNRDNILGELGWGSGTTYGRAGVIVERGDDFPERLAAMADEMTTGTYTPANNAKHIRYITNNTAERSRAVVIGADGDIYQAQGERLVNLHDVVSWQVKDKKKTAKRDAQLRGLVGLRKAYGRLIDAERDGAPETEALRQTLRDQYEAFRDAHGPVRQSEGIRLLREAEDPFYPSLMALERVRDGVIEPMPILHRSVVRSAAKIDKPTVRDAYVVERNEGLHIDMRRIATAAAVSVEDAERELVAAGAVYRLPGGGYEPSDVYLGGNVRRKLREARAAAEQGEDMARNIEHLEKVIPKDVPYFNIEAKLGAQWVGAKHYRDFVAEVIIGNADVAENLELEWRINRWVVKPSDAHQDTPTALRWTEVNAYEEGFTVDGRNGAKVPMLNEDGTPLMMLRDSGRVRLRQLLEAAFNNGTMKFTAKDDDGNTYTREAFSAAANERAGAIREAFEEWVWKSPERKVALERDYNEVMNAIADPQFDGSFLAFDGMALQRGDNEFDLRSHQSNAIWRGLVQGSGLYAHEVGTGKTYTIGGISVESRRFGLAQKPLILAHNANSASVAAEIQEMYPGAKVLYVNNLDSSRVKETMAQIRNDDWDAVVMPHSLLDRLTLKRETLNALAAEDIAALESAFWEAMDEGDENQAGFGRAVHADMMDDEEAIKKLRNPTAKELANARLRIKAQIEKQAQQSSREDAIAFEDLGVDMLIVDEAHLFKKPPMATRMKMRGLQKQISNRSVALKFLTDYIKGQHAGRGVHLFTGTPITNTLAEIFHMQRYVMQQDMARDGIDQWDSWFNTFASGVSDVEFTAAGDYQPVTKLAGFINVAELRRMMSPYMDVVFADEMPEFTPRKTASGKTLADEGLTADEIDTLQNGRQENPVGRPYKKVVMDVAEMSPEQAAILARLQKLAAEWRSAGGKQRMEWMKSGDPHSPIMIEGAAARAGMDARMEDLSLPDHPESKVNRAVRNLLHHYRGEPEAAQVVFMDKGYSDTRTVAKVRVPGHNLAKELRTKLIAEGVPAHEIAIVAGGVTPEQKKAVADAVNSGTVRIVIGQTETLGTGVNMQRRLRAMHHLDAPWMPGELEQRNGRGWRQGNTWNTVLEYRYITERIDGKRWQVLAVKDRFIKAFLHADADTRVIEGDAVSDDEGGGYAETLSEAVGDPRLLQRQKLTVDVQKLQRRERTHAQGVVEAREKLARNERLVPEKEAQAKRYDADADLFEQAEAVAGERQQDAYREEVAVYVDGLGLKLTAAERAAVRADGWGNKQTDRELAKRVQAAVKAAEAEGNQRPKEPTTKPFDARLLNDRFTTRDAFNEAEKTLNQRMPQGAGWIPVGELFGFPLEAHRVGRETVYLQVASLTEPGVRYGVYGAITDTLRGLRGTGRQVRAEAANLRADRPKLEELADQPFARAKDLERKQARLAEIEADMARNPVPAPAWLRHGAPVDTLAYVKGKEVVVEGHQWADDGYFVHVLDGERARRVPYLDLRDANGERKYTEHPFVAPSGANVAAADALPAGVWVVELANRPAQAPRWINVEDLAQLKAHGTTVRRATASDWQALSLWERMNRPAGIGEQVLDALGAMARGQRARAEAARAPAVPQTPEQVAVIASVEPSADQKAERAAVAARAKKAYLAARLTLGQYEAARALVRGGETARVSRALEIVETTGRQPSLAMMAAEAYKMEVDVDRILALTGPSMYSGGFAETALKEMAQNAVDAAATNTKGTPTVLINIDSQQRLITVADNGNGMLPREVRSKFFTLGGSGKTGVGTGGGFGLGKAIFLMGSEWVELSTVKGTKRTTARVTPAHLLGKGGKKITPEVTEVPAGTPSGTVVRIKVPESYVSERGEASSIYMPWDLKQVEMFQNFMLAPVEVLSTQRDYAYADNVPSLTIGIEALAREFGYGARPEPIKTGLRTDFEGTQLKKYTRMNFSWGTADLYLGQQREDWPKHAVLSNGIYQFDPSFMVRLGERVPYAVVLDVHSSVKADDPSYPFNNQRQGFRSSIEEDNAKLRDYIAMVARGADAQATAQTFSDMQQLPRMEVDTDEPAPNVPRAPVEIKRPKPTGKGLEAAPAVVTIDNTGIKVPDKKAPSGLRELTVPSLNERRAPGSMQAERAAPVQEDFLKAFDLDVSKPVYHNNTNVDWIAEGTGYGDAGALFAELGTVAVQLREVVGKLKMYGFAALDSDKTPVFTGISIDKEYRGVHIRVPAHALFLNPLALPRHLTTLRGVTQAYYKTLVHELAHTRSMKHDESFVLTMHEIEERLSDDGTDMEIVERLADILARHEAVLTHLRSIYDQSTTRNVAQSLEKQQKDAASQGWAADDLEGPGDAGGGTRTGADAGRWGTGGRGLPGRGDREDQGDTGDGDASAVGGDGTEVDGSVRPRFALGGAAPNFALAQHRISRPRAAGVEPVSVAWMQARADADPLVRVLRERHGVTVRVLADESGLGAEALAELARVRRQHPEVLPKATWVPGSGAGGRGEILLVAGNLRDGREGLRLILEEGVGHFGLTALLGPQFGGFLDTVVRDFNPDVAAWARAYGLDMQDQGERRRAAEEFLAHNARFAADAPRGLLERVYEAIKDALRALGWTLRLTDGDLRGVLAAARRFVETGRGATGVRARVGGPVGARATGARGMFAGQGARTADAMALATAQARLAAGEDDETVRKATGWHQGADGKWRFEIDDSSAVMMMPVSAISEYTNLPLPKVIAHDALFAAYPMAETIRVMVSSGTKEKASYDPLSRTIALRDDTKDADALSFMLHEIQHYVQTSEGLASGVNPKNLSQSDNVYLIDGVNWRDIDWSLVFHILEQIPTDTEMTKRRYVVSFSDEEKKTILAKMEKERKAAIKKAATAKRQHAKQENTKNAESLGAAIQLLESKNAFTVEAKETRIDRYWRTSGEVEARNTEARRALTAAERRATVPSATQDVPDTDVIVTFNGREMASAPRPANAGEPANPDIRFALAPPADSGGSPLGGGRALMDSIREVIDRTGEWAGGRWRQALPTTLGAVTLRQLADLGAAHIPGIKGYLAAQQRMDTRRNEMTEESGVFAEETWQAWARKREHRVAAEALASLMHDATREQVDPADYKVLEVALKLGPSDLFWRTRQATEANVRELERQARQMVGGEPTAQDVADLMRERQQQPGAPTDPKALRAAVLATWKAGAGRAEDRGMSGYYVAAAQQLKAAVATQKARERALPALQARWNALSPQAQEIYRTSRDMFTKRSAAMVDALEARVMALEGIDEARKRALAAKMRADFEAPFDEKGNPRIGPYFPLQRFGRFYLFARRFPTGAARTFRKQDGGLFASEDAARNALKRRDLKGVEARAVAVSDPTSGEISGWELQEIGDPGFWMAESIAERRQLAAELRGQGWTVERQGLTKEARKELEGVSEGFIAEAVELLRSKGSGKEADELYQLYLGTLQQMSIRKHFVHRKGTTGYSNDALRSFAWNMTRLASQVAKLEHVPTLERILRDIEDDKKERQRVLVAEGGDVTVADAFLEELKKRHQWVVAPDNAPWTNFTSALGFFWYLGATPAAALVNVTQTPIMALPILASRYGWGAASRALGAAAVDVARGFTPAVLKGYLVGRAHGGLPANLSDDERRAVDEWALSGVQDRTQAHNLAGIGDSDSFVNGPAFNRVMAVISSGFHAAEVFNRDATLLAGYRLAREKGASHRDAVQAAEADTWIAHFDYGNSNRARWMQSNAAKALLMFRSYSQHVLYFLWRNLYQGLKGESVEVRRQARTQLLGSLGMTGLFAGALGLPLMGTVFMVANLAAAAFGDDDEPWDAEIAFRNWLAETFPDSIATALDRGAVTAATGLDWSSRVGMQTLVWRAPDRDLDGEASYFYVVEQLLGPLGGIFASPWEAADLVAEGQWQRAAETLAPKALKDVLRAGRFATEGVVSMKGAPIVERDELNAYQIAWKAMGMNPDAVAVRQDANAAVKLYEGRILDRRSRLMTAYAMAVIHQDADGQANLLPKIRAFNLAQPMIPITPRSIRTSVRNRTRAVDEAAYGMSVNRRLRETVGAAGAFGG